MAYDDPAGLHMPSSSSSSSSQIFLVFSVQERGLILKYHPSSSSSSFLSFFLLSLSLFSRFFSPPLPFHSKRVRAYSCRTRGSYNMPATERQAYTEEEEEEIHWQRILLRLIKEERKREREGWKRLLTARVLCRVVCVVICLHYQRECALGTERERRLVNFDQTPGLILFTNLNSL